MDGGRESHVRKARDDGGRLTRDVGKVLSIPAGAIEMGNDGRIDSR